MENGKFFIELRRALIMDEKKIEEFRKQLESFEKGFAMISQNITSQLDKIVVQVTQLSERAKFMPKMVQANKKMEKEIDKTNLLVSTLMDRLNRVITDKML